MSYYPGYSDEAIHWISGRTIENQLYFLSHYLKDHSFQGKSVLDCGSGTGELAFQIASMGYRVVGFDLESEKYASNWSLLEAQAKEKGYSLELRGGIDATDVQFLNDSSFDIVFFLTVLYHLHNPQKALSEAHRLLRPGGLLATSDTDPETTVFLPTNEFVDSARRAIERHAEKMGEHHRFGREHPKYLREEGFEIKYRSASYDYCSGKKIQSISTMIVKKLESPDMRAFFEDERNHDLLPGSGDVGKRMKTMADQVTLWGKDQDAFVAVSRFEVLGEKPKII
ncbi:MAG: methyltransferase domain-containing protein [Candidatus Thiodiazotropha endolucinida]